MRKMTRKECSSVSRIRPIEKAMLQKTLKKTIPMDAIVSAVEFQMETNGKTITNRATHLSNNTRLSKFNNGASFTETGLLHYVCTCYGHPTEAARTKESSYRLSAYHPTHRIPTSNYCCPKTGLMDYGNVM